MNNNSPPLTFKRFQTIVSRLELPRRPLPPVTQQQMDQCRTKISDNHDQLYSIPSLEELGFRTAGLPAAVFRGGESEALDRLNKHLDKKVWVANFEHPRVNTCSLYASPTGLSPYLRFGCLSCRVLYYNLRELYMKLRKRCSPPLSLFGQLLWREFFYTAATNNPNFDRMDGNPICVQIPWDQNPEALAKWAEGRTGFPWIDAIMTQLRQEGWIHHLARHAVACFLTRGDMWISWESGMKVFEELLLDADWSVNAGSWMWLSCSAFFQQFFHCYCPVGFGRRTDPSGDYIRRYIPVLKDFPNRYIYEPWNAPESVQKAANCVVGVNYPKPMINHAESSRLNIERMKQVYQQLSHYRGLSSPLGDEFDTEAAPDSSTVEFRLRDTKRRRRTDPLRSSRRSFSSVFRESDSKLQKNNKSKRTTANQKERQRIKKEQQQIKKNDNKSKKTTTNQKERQQIKKEEQQIKKNDNKSKKTTTNQKRRTTNQKNNNKSKEQQQQIKRTTTNQKRRTTNQKNNNKSKEQQQQIKRTTTNQKRRTTNQKNNNKSKEQQQQIKRTTTNQKNNNNKSKEQQQIKRTTTNQKNNNKSKEQQHKRLVSVTSGPPYNTP
ncbi:hypothetical protein F2P81_006763 [Scophthalmus maximus]|uniref:Cryptochrome/DNA photolyase FAD-binding domain-containing protein n=1 Tax=Scophthalmus maximus TaxID=52904 RepID=A0A6A4T6S2_SCOMX|nr:hypothetical protein F2P81_006763 [Scophthalmus maximus]